MSRLDSRTGSGRRCHLSLGPAITAILIAIPVSAQAASVYVTNSDANQVSQYNLGAGGKLSPKSPPKVAAGRWPWGIAVSPNGKNVYVADRAVDAVSQYSVGTAEKLFPKNPARVPAGDGPNRIAVSPDGRSVYVTNEWSNNVSQYTVGAGGKLSPKTPAKIATTGYGPSEVVVSPDGDSVYVLNGFANCFEATGAISQYDIGPNGRLSPKSPPCVDAPGQSSGLAISPDGKDVYVAWYFCGGSTCHNRSGIQWDVGAGGLLSQSGGFFTGCDGASAVTVSPNSRSAYITTSCNRVRQYNRGPNGALTSKSPAGVAAGTAPRGLATSANGNHLYVANFSSNNVSQYTIGAAGKLSLKNPALVAAGARPVGVATNPPAIP